MYKLKGNEVDQTEMLSETGGGARFETRDPLLSKEE